MGEMAAGSDAMSEYNVVVGLGNPENVERLMCIGCMMANEYQGRVEAITVVDIDCEAPEATPDCPDRMSRAYDVLEIAENMADHCGADFEGHLAVGREVPAVLDEMAHANNADLIIVGFSEREHPRGDGSDFERLVDEIAHAAPCNLLVARFVDDVSYERVLAPVRARLNLDVRRDLVVALQNQFHSTVDVVHFACSENEVEDMRDELEDWLRERGVWERINLKVEVHQEPAQAIVEASEDYDLVLLGTSPLHEVRRKYFGAVPEFATVNAACSTFLVRTHDIERGD
jgi:nucleotide-binding universal stress UspA family protein